MTTFGQVVIGPPGSGKTTYCKGMSEFLRMVGRDVVCVNMDPANDILPFKYDLDISELITLGDVMDNLKLGPNGGLVYCMEYLEKNIDWLKKKLDKFRGKYILFDCPGQVELYTHHMSVRNIIEQLQKWDFRLVAMHLVDSHYCSDPGKFIAVLLTSLSTMLQIELPHINVLSKMDLIQKFGKLPFNLEFFTDVLDLGYLLDQFKDDPVYSKYKKLNAALVDLIENYSLVSFIPLDIQDKECVLRVQQAADKANGYLFGDLDERNIQNMLSFATGAEFQYDKIKNVQEKYVDEDCSKSSGND